ncbi:hypothetical protein Tco_1220324, partial [Tanacetum coccineum]
LQDTSIIDIVGAKLSSRGSTSVAGMYQTLSCMFKLSSRGSVGLATPDWLLAAGCWLLAAGCWLLAAGCWLLLAS